MDLAEYTIEIIAVLVGLIILSVGIKIVSKRSDIETTDEVGVIKRMWERLTRNKILLLLCATSVFATSCSFLESVGVDRLIGSAVDGLIPADSIYIDYDGAYIELPYYQNIDTTLAKGEFWVRWMQHDSLVLIEYLPHDTTLKRD